MDHSKILERKAEAVGENPKSLLRRLNEARSCLASDWKDSFKNARFDKANKRLVSSCGCYALEWRLRTEPDEPVSYENQQTATGTVVLIEIHKPRQNNVRQLSYADEAEKWWADQGKKVPPRDDYDNVDPNSPWQKMYRAWYKQRFPWIFNEGCRGVPELKEGKR